MKTKLKQFRVHFRHRDNADGSKMLNDVFETGEARSKAEATAWGRRVAEERGWWFMSAEKVT